MIIPTGIFFLKLLREKKIHGTQSKLRDQNNSVRNTATEKQIIMAICMKRGLHEKNCKTL